MSKPWVVNSDGIKLIKDISNKSLDVIEANDWKDHRKVNNCSSKRNRDDKYLNIMQ